MKWSWRIPSEPARTLVLDFNYWTGGKRVSIASPGFAGTRSTPEGSAESIDGEVVPTQSKTFGWSHTFPVGTQVATLRVKVKYLAVPEASLEIDGRVIEPIEGPRALPAWTWAFVLANLAILVASRGGAIPGAIAGVGAVGVIGSARSNLAIAARLGLCVLVTAAAWGAFYGLRHALS